LTKRKSNIHQPLIRSD